MPCCAGLPIRIEWYCGARGKPIRIALVGSFNGPLRAECFNEYVFTTLAEAQRVFEGLPMDCNTARPHGRVGWLPPAVFGAPRKLQEHRGRTVRPDRGFAPREFSSDEEK